MDGTVSTLYACACIKCVEYATKCAGCSALNKRKGCQLSLGCKYIHERSVL